VHIVALELASLARCRYRPSHPPRALAAINSLTQRAGGGGWRHTQNFANEQPPNIPDKIAKTLHDFSFAEKKALKLTKRK
jgi:hypothetical protein